MLYINGCNDDNNIPLMNTVSQRATAARRKVTVANDQRLRGTEDALAAALAPRFNDS